MFWEPLKQELFSENVNLAPHFFEQHQVTSEDFKLYFDAIMNPYNQQAGAISLRTYLGDIKEIEILDKLTFIVRWNTANIKQDDGTVVPKIKYIAKLWICALRPLASFVYKYFPDGTKIIEDDSAPNAYRTSSLWGQNFTQHWARNIIVGCGPWIFEEMTDRQIAFKRNPNYYVPLAALTNKQEIEFKTSSDAIWQDFKASKLDTYVIMPEQLIELVSFMKSEPYAEQAKKGLAIKSLEYVASVYFYIGWNQAKPFFKSKKVRQAMTMAIDRERIFKQILNGMGVETTGPFSVDSPAYDHSIVAWPFDLHRAKRLLEEEGWFDSDGDGVIDKVIDGKKVPFHITLTYLVKNPVMKAICEYVATALRELGIICNLNGVDRADISNIFEDKSFDALGLGWGGGAPPEDPRQLWHSSGAKEKGSSNGIGFANAEADEIIEKLEFETDLDKRIALYHRFHAIIHDEAPYTFLYAPKSTLLYREYVQNVFIPSERQDLIPGADVSEPQSSIFWIKH